MDMSESAFDGTCGVANKRGGGRMNTKSNTCWKKMLGISLILGWWAVVLYSSYRIQSGFTEIGKGFVAFLDRMLRQFNISSDRSMEELEYALHAILHLEAYILLGVFAGTVFAWWKLRGKRRLILILTLGLAVALTDEWYQVMVLKQAWGFADLFWELTGVVVGLKIQDFVAYSNR